MNQSVNHLPEQVLTMSPVYTGVQGWVIMKENYFNVSHSI